MSMGKVFCLGDGVQMEFVPIPAGTFMMGSPENEEARNRDELQVEVSISRDFWLGRTTVTQAQWKAIMGSNPSFFGEGLEKILPVGSLGRSELTEYLEYPVECVSWEDAMAFCEKLTERECAAGRLPYNMKFTLPTEAQWEYACRAGTATRFYFGDDEAMLPKFGNVYTGRAEEGYSRSTACQ